MNKLEQAARQLKELLIRPNDTIAEMYCYGMGDIDDALAALREALAEQAEQEPVIDLSKVRHEDKCRYWDDETFCDCGADSHALLEWHRNNKAAPVQQAEREPVAIDGLARACNLAGIDYKDFLRIKAYLPIAAPVRTKDLTDDEIDEIYSEYGSIPNTKAIRAVIAKDREKNK